MQIKAVENKMSLFGDVSEEKVMEYHIEQRAPDDLETFPDSPFRIYTDCRRDKLLESIKANGILQPLVVWRVAGHQYILSGGNRCSCARKLRLPTVPCIVKEHITKNQAIIILVETNFVQRSLFEMLSSEKAKAFRMQFEAYKAENKKLGTAEDIKALKNADEASDDAAFENVATRLQRTSARDKIAMEYGLSGFQIYQYIRLTYLIKELLYLVDKGTLSLKSGVALSYLPDDIQRKLYALIRDKHISMDLKTAERLKTLYREKELTMENLEEALSRPSIKKKSASVSVKLPADVIDRYFSDRRKRKEIAQNVTCGLDIYKTVMCTAEKYQTKVDDAVGLVKKALHLYFEEHQKQ